MGYRIVVCVDIDAPSLLEAYGKLYETMAKVTGPNTGLDWESSEEAYDSDGEEIDEEILQKARMEYLDNRTKDFGET